MQHMGPFDASQNKALFKKRIHRPWHTSLEAPLLLPAVEERVSLTSDLPPSPPMDTLSNTQGIASMDIQQSLPSQTEAVLIGGFFYPKQNTDKQVETSPTIHNLMQELRTKEQDILRLDHDLQVGKALEEARQAEVAHAHEATARKSAEENALFAIQKAKVAVEQAHKAENQVLAEKQLRLELERTKKALEERLQHALKTIEKEDGVRKDLEEKLVILKTQTDGRTAAIQREAERKIQEAQEQIALHEKAKLTAQSFTQKTMESARQSEAARLLLEEQIDALQRKNTEQLTIIQSVELQKTLLTQALERTKHLESIIEVEKELRKHCEQKMTESHIRAEEAKRKVSEDKLLFMEQEIADLEATKSRIEDKLFKTQRSIRNLEIMRLSSE
jgi:hypothetical protein